MLLSIVLPAADPASPIERWQGAIGRAAIRFNVPRDWIVQVMRQESGGHTVLNGRPIRSSKGAIGLMQIMPATWQMLRDTYGLGADPDDPEDNIAAGAAYLRSLYARFGYPALFAAYHAGPTRYQLFQSGRGDLPTATLIYTRRILTGLQVDMLSACSRRARAPREHALSLFVSLSQVPSSHEAEAIPVERPSAYGDCFRAGGLWAVPPRCGAPNE